MNHNLLALISSREAFVASAAAALPVLMSSLIVASLLLLLVSLIIMPSLVMVTMVTTSASTSSASTAVMFFLVSWHLNLVVLLSCDGMWDVLLKCDWDGSFDWDMNRVLYILR